MLLYAHHIHYVVTNLDEMVAYLDENFGMKPDFVGINSNGKEARYEIDKTRMQMVEPLPGSKQEKYLAEHGPGVYHVAWAVEDAEKLGQELVAKGIKLQQSKGTTRDLDPVCNIDPASSLGVRFQLVTSPN
jgi:4-hydroxyphenylpyruvate dioxygenase and related hemolysins